MNAVQLMKKARSLEERQALGQIREAIQESKQKEVEEREGNKPSPYNPAQKRLDRLTSGELIHNGTMGRFYPTNHVTFSVGETNFLTFIEKCYRSFKKGQIERMTVETRLEVIECAKVGFSKKVRQYRRDILPERCMDTERYETERLEYLMAHTEEPILINEDVFLEIENVGLKYFELGSRTFFSLTEANKIGGVGLYIQGARPLAREFSLALLRVVPFMSDSLHSDLQRYLIDNLHSVERLDCFKNYHEYKTPPLSFQMPTNANQKDYQNDSRRNRMVSLLTGDKLDNLLKLGDDEEVLRICRQMIELGESYEKDFLMGEARTRNKHIQKDFEVLFSRLPRIVGTLEKLYDRSLVSYVKV